MIQRVKTNFYLRMRSSTRAYQVILCVCLSVWVFKLVISAQKKYLGIKGCILVLVLDVNSSYMSVVCGEPNSALELFCFYFILDWWMMEELGLRLFCYIYWLNVLRIISQIVFGILEIIPLSSPALAWWQRRGTFQMQISCQNTKMAVTKDNYYIRLKSILILISLYSLFLYSKWTLQRLIRI